MNITDICADNNVINIRNKHVYGDDAVLLLLLLLLVVDSLQVCSLFEGRVRLRSLVEVAGRSLTETGLTQL